VVFSNIASMRLALGLILCFAFAQALQAHSEQVILDQLLREHADSGGLFVDAFSHILPALLKSARVNPLAKNAQKLQRDLEVLLKDIQPFQVRE
jgi:hypothetical protein